MQVSKSIFFSVSFHRKFPEKSSSQNNGVRQENAEH